MRTILIFLICLPSVAHAQKTDSVMRHKNHVAHRKPEGFAEIGFMTEQWILTSHLPSGYSAVSYGGKGLFLGGGFRTRTDEKKPLGFGLSADYINYTMKKALQTDQLVQTGYSFLRFSPGAYLLFKSKAAVHFEACANVSLLVPVQSKENSYVQFGIRGIMSYKSYGLTLGYNFAQGGGTPNTDISINHWGEHAISVGGIVYPSRIKKTDKAAKFQTVPEKK